MSKRLLVILLTVCMGLPAFSQGFFRRGGKGAKRAKTPAVPSATARQVRGGGITEKGPLARTYERQGPITRGVQQGVLRHLEQPSVTRRIPATRSNPAFEFGRKLREYQESSKIFVTSVHESFKFFKRKGREKPLQTAVKIALNDATIMRTVVKDTWAQKEQTPERQFYFNDLLAVFYFHGQFSAAQLRDMRGFYEKTISRPDVFTSDIAFADALSSFIGISFVGDAYLAEKMVSFAKAAPEGKRFLTDFVVVRSLLNLERYDLVQELLDLRQAQERWTQQGVSKGETARVYEEVKLYQQTVKTIPVTFPEELPARNKLARSPEMEDIQPLMAPRSQAMMFQGYLPRFDAEIPENSAEGLNWFLQYKHRDFSKKPQ